MAWKSMPQRALIYPLRLTLRARGAEVTETLPYIPLRRETRNLKRAIVAGGRQAYLACGGQGLICERCRFIPCYSLLLSPAA